jgi:hypothetical protein
MAEVFLVLASRLAPFGFQDVRACSGRPELTRAELTDRSVGSGLPSSEMAIDEEQRSFLIAQHSELVEELGGSLLFFDLLGDEAEEERLRGMVALLEGELVQLVDRLRDCLLVLEHLLERRDG